VKPSRINKARSRFTAVSASAAILLGLAILYGAGTASAADGRPTRTQASRADRTAMPMSPRGVIERRQLIIERRGMPEVAPGGTVVLRGRRSPATPNITPSGPNLNGAGYGASSAPVPILPPGAGWDRELDYRGLDYGGATPLVVTSP
jgi:hypothetical protein